MSLRSLFFRRDTLIKPRADADHRSEAWPFDQAPNAGAITTRQVMDGVEEVHVVVHYSDDHSWGFLCGTTDQAEDGRVVAMKDLVALDDSLRGIGDLPPGWKAWRERRGDAWQRSENFTAG